MTTEKEVKVEIKPKEWKKEDVELKLTYPASEGEVGQYSQDGINQEEAMEK